MKKNISRRGRVARAITGTLCVGAGVAMWQLGWPESTTWRCVLAVASTAAGLFQMFEACCAWCIVRALGFRTPM